jgi:glycosyltransferase involved in cell wall biosynthesis
MLSVPAKLASRFVMSRADAVIALSQPEEKFQRNAYPLAGAIHRTIPNGISTDCYKFKRENSAGKGRPWRLVFVGQLIEQKQVDKLLRALARLPQNIELQLVFHVDLLREKLEQLTRQLGLQDRVAFLGAKSPAELASIYQQADLMVLPSFGEALPSVVTEAMLCGTPVVATDVGGIRDQLGGFGTVVPPGDVDQLAKAIAEVIDHYVRFIDNAEAMSQYARRRFSIDAMVESHLEVYRSLLEQKEPRRHRRVLGRPLNAVAQLAVNMLCKTS